MLQSVERYQVSSCPWGFIECVYGWSICSLNPPMTSPCLEPAPSLSWLPAAHSPSILLPLPFLPPLPPSTSPSRFPPHHLAIFTNTFSSLLPFTLLSSFYSTLSFSLHLPISLCFLPPVHLFFWLSLHLSPSRWLIFIMWYLCTYCLFPQSLYASPCVSVYCLLSVQRRTADRTNGKNSCFSSTQGSIVAFFPLFLKCSLAFPHFWEGTKQHANESLKTP